MVKSYHQDDRYIDKFKNTSCYTNLTSRILSAARGGRYYGPTEGQYTARWQYKPAATKCRCLCKKMCDAIREELYVASTKSCIMISDQATEWYRQQKQLQDEKRVKQTMKPNDLTVYNCRCSGDFQSNSPPVKCLDMKPPIRSMKCSQFEIQKSVSRISPEFLELLKQHDMRVKKNSYLSCLPPNYTNRRIIGKKLPDPDPCVLQKDITCVDDKPCVCGTNMILNEFQTTCVKSDTRMDRRNIKRKGFFQKWFFQSSDQVYPAETDNFYCDSDNPRRLQHYNRSQPRFKLHTSCPDVCTVDTCKYASSDHSDTTVTPRFPQAHAKWVVDAPQEKRKPSQHIPDGYRPQYHKHESVENLWTKPNATEMRYSQVYLGPRFHDTPPETEKICSKQPKYPLALAISCKPEGYVLGDAPKHPQMTKTRELKRKYACLRKVCAPRYRVQECPIVEEKPKRRDTTCYPHMHPRFIPLGPGAKKFDSVCTKRKRNPVVERGPPIIYSPPTRPQYHKVRRLAPPLTPCPTGEDLHPRFHEIPPVNRKSILKRSANRDKIPNILNFKNRPDHILAEGFPCYTNERFRRIPNADETTDDSDDGQRTESDKKTEVYHPKMISTGSRSKWSDKLGTGTVRRRSPSARKYRAPVCILKGHETCYRDSNHWAGIPSNYPHTFLEKAKQNEKELKMLKNLRKRMWNTKECSIPKYAPASKCEVTLDRRPPCAFPHKALYTPRKRMTIQDASPYHRSCYRSSSGAES